MRRSIKAMCSFGGSKRKAGRGRAKGAPTGGGHSVIGFDVSFPCIIGFFCCPGVLPDC